ncbi:hypothetical protein FRC08_017761 [Ceratobasidium sp. 394]|nr:hypothetical protein FRC08_017761 [Ceratobasidium sp. 394]
MSWSGFKKNLNRAGTTLMQKTGQIERTVDREFADEEAKYKAFEKETTALQKESKAYLDAMRAMTAAQTRLAETIDTFYAAADKASEGAMAGHAYKRSVDDLDAGVTRELDAPYRTTVLEPVGKMCAYFPVINEGIAKRNKKLLDYDAARSRVRKLVDKPSEDATKLPRAQAELDEAKEVFDLMNDQLIAELPQLLDLRVPYFDPSFEAMIRMQCKFAEEGYEKLGGVQRYFADNVREDYAAGQLDAQVEGVLAEMKDLSICDPVPTPDIKWGIYLLRANYRFGLWLEKVVKKPERVRGEIGELTDGEIPPIDVLVLLHAYLLNPVNYYEDTENAYGWLKVIGGFPLDRVGGSQMKRLEGNEVVYTPTHQQVEEWELATQQPYVLPLVTTLGDTVDLVCPMCGNQDLHAPWLTKPTFTDTSSASRGRGYAQSGFSVVCQNCQGAVTKQAMQAERFARDFARVRNEFRQGRDAWFLNSFINVHTGKPAPTSATNFARLTIDTILDLDETSVYPPHIALGHYFGWDLGEAQRLIEAGFRRRGSTRAWMGDSISRMMRGFRTRGPVSLDVVGAAMRQYKFAAQMEELGWTDKLYFASAFDDTSRLWKSRFNENYSNCGCGPPQPTLSSPSKLKFWKKPTNSNKDGDTSLSPTATHPTDHNSMLAANPRRAVEESQRARAASLAKSSNNSGHPQAFFGDYQNVDTRTYSELGTVGWDLDCVRQPFIVDGKQNRGDCCVGVHISCSTISHMSATGEGAVGSRAAMAGSSFGAVATGIRSRKPQFSAGYAIQQPAMNNFEDAPFHVDLPVFHTSFPLPYRVFLLIGLGIFFWATNLHVLHLLGIDTVWVLDLRRDKLPASSPPTPLPTTRTAELPYDISSLEAVSLYKSVYKLLVSYGLWIGAGWACFRWMTGGVSKSVDAYKTLPAFTAVGIIFGLVCPFNVLMKRERYRFLRLLAVIVNSVYSFWWDVTNDWGLTLLKPSTWPAQHAAMAPRSPFLRSQSRPRSARSTPPLITLSRNSSSTALSAMGSSYSDADGIMRGHQSYPFGLRDNLLFRDSLVYYLVIFLNLFLRFTWSLKLSTHLDTVEELESSVFLIEALEVTRRWVWVFFRVEWEAIKKEQASSNGDNSARIYRAQTPNEEIEFDLLGPSRATTPDPTLSKGLG